jgi:hypothetical protein
MQTVTQELMAKSLPRVSEQLWTWALGQCCSHCALGSSCAELNAFVLCGSTAFRGQGQNVTLGKCPPKLKSWSPAPDTVDKWGNL